MSDEFVTCHSSLVTVTSVIPRRDFIAALPAFAVAVRAQRGAPPTAASFMYVGSFTPPERGHGEGVTIFRRAGTGRWAQVHVVKDLENPSFLIADRQGRYLYSVH